MSDATFTLAVTTPIGQIVLESDGDFLTGVVVSTHDQVRRNAQRTTTPMLRDAAAQLDEYFAHERTKFELRTRLNGTPFQQEVWAALCNIPYGTTISYGELARRIQRPRAHRAVGQANAKNPLPIIVPCHRVVACDSLGGYAGGLVMKRQLLAVEERSP